MIEIVPSPKNFPDALLFRTDEGRYIRVTRQTVERYTDRYVLQMQAFEVDEGDNLLDTPTGDASRAAKTRITLVRSMFAAGTQVMRPGWAKTTPPLGQEWSRETLPENAEYVDQLPEVGNENQLYFTVDNERGQFWRFDAKGELQRLMEQQAEEADTMWKSLALEQEDGL